MAMSNEAKTQPTAQPVAAFIAAVPDPRRRAEAAEIDRLMSEITGLESVMWGPSIIGYGTYRNTYANGRQGDWPRTGFSPRKAALTLYLSSEYARHAELMARLGKHTTSVACLYIKRLDDVDRAVLRELIEAGWQDMARRYPPTG